MLPLHGPEDLPKLGAGKRRGARELGGFLPVLGELTHRFVELG